MTRPERFSIEPGGGSGDERLAERLAKVTFEIGSKAKGADDLSGRVAPGSEVFISCLPRDTWQVLKETTAAVAAAGFRPVPHIPVRRLASRGEAVSVIAALHSAGAERLLLIAGDTGLVKGPFASTREILEDGLVSACGIKGVFVAGHPEGSDYVEGERAFDILGSKLAVAKAQGLDAGVVTQFCFSAAPYAAWLEKYCRRGMTAPVRLGLAGPASARTLLQLALRCGVGDSLSALQRRLGTATALLKDSVMPDDVVLDLGSVLTGEAGDVVAGFHVFPFGGLAKSVQWHRTLMGRLNLRPAGDRIGA